MAKRAYAVSALVPEASFGGFRELLFKYSSAVSVVNGIDDGPQFSIDDHGSNLGLPLRILPAKVQFVAAGTHETNFSIRNF